MSAEPGMGQQSATDVLLDLIQNAKHGIGGDLRLVEVHIVSCRDDLRHHSTGASSAKACWPAVQWASTYGSPNS